MSCFVKSAALGDSPALAAVAKPSSESSAPPVLLPSCQHCGTTFSSRNKLFKHITQCSIEHEQPESKKRALSEDAEDDNSATGPSPAAVESVLRVHGPGVEYAYRIVIKPQGMPTMGSVYTQNLRSHDAMIMHVKLEGGKTRELLPEEAQGLCDMSKLKLKRAVPVHRLDAATGGLIIAAESSAAEGRFGRMFMQHHMQKRYRAVLHGLLGGESATEVASDPTTTSSSSGSGSSELRYFSEAVDGKEATTAYRIVSTTDSSRHGWLTVVDLFPVSGRKHQLRKHMKSLGCPIVGDRRYAHSHMWPLDEGRFPWLFLWAVELRFPDPNTYSDVNNISSLDPLWHNIDMSLTTEPSDDVDTATLLPPSPATITTTTTTTTTVSAPYAAIVRMHNNTVHVRISAPKYYTDYLASERNPQKIPSS
jgi:23S rRNA-/tRNA-specific pseudouridylate synthase